MAIDPMTAAIAMGGASAAGAIGNYYTNKENQRARERETGHIENLINALQDPQFDLSYLTPEDYKLLKEYKPEVAAYVAERAPQLVTGAGPGAQEGLDAQLSALQKYRDLSASGEDIQSRVLRDRALRQAQIQNQGQQGQIMNSFQRRGAGGSGMELAARLIGQQGSNLAGQRSAEQAAMDAYNTKLMALRESANLGGDIRKSEVALEGKNAGTINDWNQRMANSYRGWTADRANTLNDAQYKNLIANQNIANANVGQRNQSKTAYQNLRNKYAQQRYENDVGKVGLRTGVANQRMGNAAASAQEQKDMINSLVVGGTQAVAAGAAGNKPETNVYVQGGNNQQDPQGKSYSLWDDPEMKNKYSYAGGE